MSGFVELPTSHAPQFLPAGVPKNAKAGELIVIRIVRPLSHGRWQVERDGRLFTVSSRVPLTPGRLMTVQSFRLASRVFLRPTDATPAPTDIVEKLFRQLGLPADPAGRAAVEAILRTGALPTESALRRMKELFERKLSTDAHLARLAALLLDKGIDPLNPIVEEICQLSEHPSSRGDEPDSWGGSDANKKSPNEPDSSDGGPTASPSLATQMRWALERAAASRREEPSSDGPAARSAADVLALVNHLRARHANWLVIPFALRAGEELLEGSARVRTDGAARDVAIVVASNGRSGRVAFHLSGGRSKRLTVYLDDPRERAAAAALLPELRENLRNLGIQVDDTMKDGDRFDGFGEVSIPRRPIDTVA